MKDFYLFLPINPMSDIIKKYTDDDMMFEIELARRAIKKDINTHINFYERMNILSKEIQKYCRIEINNLLEADKELVKRHNIFYHNKNRDDKA